MLALKYVGRTRCDEIWWIGLGEGWGNAASPHRQVGRGSRARELCGSGLDGAGPGEHDRAQFLGRSEL